MSRRILAWLTSGVCVVALSVWYPPTDFDAPGRSHAVPVSSPRSAEIDFQRDVLPILSSRCFSCHGPDPTARKAGLRLDQRDAALKKSRRGSTPIVPGKPEESEILRRIAHADGAERMPPAKSGKALTEAERDRLRRWIAAGAEYQQHWAFLKPRRPAPPPVKNKTWRKNPIDAFILARLDEAGLEPAPPADAVTLVRRLSLDLRGLPPTVAEVEEFVRAWDAAGAKRGQVWEHWVDRMFASPHHGEKMALAWLDLARFGDTSGYHMDSTRQMWLWRDWVIAAFNRNMPFDQFTIEQLAGDLLPDPGDASAAQARKIATGFNRNTRYNEEGGVDPEEYVIRYNIDRTNTLGQAWLGLTLGCAECHTHKFDPISHKEYYQLFAFFTGIAEPMLEGHHVHGMPLPPLLKVPTPEQAQALAELRKTQALLEKAIAKELGKISYIDPLAGKLPPGEITQEQALASLEAWQARARTDERLPPDIRASLKIDPPMRSAAQRAALREYFLLHVHPPTRDIAGVFAVERDELTRKIRAFDDAVPHTLVTQELPKPRPAHVLIRGDFLQKGERVEPGVPAVLPPLPAGASANRLGLARWLVHPDHPLTARVVANRLWAQMFGQGLVRTLGDFGTQGDFPSHPELLDWLASELVRPEGGARAWDMRRLLRTIALSATYQQSSRFRAEVIRVDPHNRLLAFMPRYRLGAEELRDSALRISGLLNPRIGGPSFMPYQPRDYYKFKNEDWPWTPSPGDEQYRRGLYAFWRRTALHPMLTTFDAPSREECVVSRPRTNTPLQALVTMNDPTFVEAARVFAQNLLSVKDMADDDRLAAAFRKATCRAPDAAEMKILRHRFAQQRERFTRDPEAASKLVNIGQYSRDARMNVTELAAWTAYCNLLLNLDEVLTRE